MFNPFNMAYQPYFIIQAPSSPGPSFIYQQSPPFLFPQLILQDTFQNGTTPSVCAIGQTLLDLQSNVSPNNRENKASEAGKSQTSMNTNIKKEKIIKKPANRPATYLTERKYYLAQTLQEEPHQNRKLRPRIIKKKSRKFTQKSLPLFQEPLKKKQKCEVSKDDKDFSYIIESSQKKKIEFMSYGVSGNSMKTMELSVSKEDSK